MSKVFALDGVQTRASRVKVFRDTPVPWRSDDEAMWSEGTVLCPDGLWPRSFRDAKAMCPTRKWHEAADSGALVVKEEL